MPRWNKETLETKRNEFVGKRFGKLVVTKYLRNEGKRSFYECICDCGKVVSRRKDSLSARGSSSCGCEKKNVEIVKGRAIPNDRLDLDQLQDKDPYEAIQMIKEFKGVDFYKSREIYTDWRKRIRVDKKAYIKK